MKSKTVTVFTVIISNLLILIFILEILSRFFLSDFMDSKLNKIRRYQFSENIDDYLNLIFVPHPYLGYIRLNKNKNFDIVHEKTKDVSDSVAVFGGSVAENFYRFNREENLLQENLKETFGLENNFGLKNYASGGYRQPQQLIAAVLFRPKVKVTINIEGYNEINDTLENQFPHYYPMPLATRLYYSGMENRDMYVKVGKTKAFQRKIKDFLEKNWWFKLVPTFLKILYFSNEKSLADFEQKLIYRHNKKKGPFKSVTFLEKIIYWLERSCEQQNFLAGRGVKAYFFFQPSPYIPQSKKELTDHEKQMIKDAKNRTTIKGFLLVRKLIEKRELSLNLVDLSQIFLDEPREIFVDGHSHFNQLGYILFTREIAKIIRETYSESEKPKLCHDDFQSLVEKFRKNFDLED